MDISKRTSQTITAGIICTAGIALFGFIALYFNTSTLNELNHDISKLSAQVEEHRILHPIFQTLLAELRGDNNATLPYPQKTKLARDDMESAMSLFKTTAETYHLNVKAIEPEIDSMAGNSGHLIMNITMDGDFLNLRGMLISLGQIPWFESLEHIRISSGENKREMRLRVSVAII